jgi:hypothetical protein
MFNKLKPGPLLDLSCLPEGKSQIWPFDESLPDLPSVPSLPKTALNLHGAR